MLKDIILSLATPFGGTKSGNKSPTSPTKQFPSVFGSIENLRHNEMRSKCGTLSRRPRRDSDSKRKRKKSNSLSDTLETTHEFGKVMKSSSLNCNKSYPINILVVGAKDVGKSALTVRFITRRYIGEYMSGENQTYSYISDDKRQQTVSFLDESSDLEGQAYMESQLGKENLAWADGIMVVYDVGDISTFNYAKKLLKFMEDKILMENTLEQQKQPEACTQSAKHIQEIWKTKIGGEYKPVLLIGNKTDLVKRRSVSDDDIKRAAESFPAWVSHSEVSAAEGFDDVTTCVNGLITNIREKQKNLCGLSSKPYLKHIVGNVFRNRSL